MVKIELILKPTELCNFKCTYCSSTDILPESARANTRLDLEKVFAFLRRFPNTRTIIVNGGDPLMMSPDYYWSIINYLDEHEINASISLTSNLWLYYKKPDRWRNLFKHDRVGVSTSFEFGGQRLLHDKTPYTEKLFRDVTSAFSDDIGYLPDFISVITDENDKYAIDNVELAQDLDVECKLNYAMASGAQTKPYQLSKIYRTYLEIYDRHLLPWEFNTKQLVRRISRGGTACPQSRHCDEGIRALNPAGDYYSCGSLADDKSMPIDYEAEVKQGKFFTPLQSSVEHTALKMECFTCPMFDICNGCRKTIVDMKKHDIVDSHCSLMKTLAPKIISMNEEWADTDLVTIQESPSYRNRMANE